MTCQHCTAKVTNGLALCAACQETLRQAFVNVAAYYTDASRITPGERVKVRAAYQSSPPPGSSPAFDPVSDILDTVDTSVTTWARMLVDDRAAGDPPTSTPRICGWLESHVPSIATLEWAGEILRSMLANERALKKVIDKADTGWFAGTCGSVLVPERSHDGFTCECACHHGLPCDVEGGCSEVAVIAAVVCERGLYASPSNRWVRCPECGSTWDSEDRRDTMRKQAEDRLAPVRVIAAVVVGLTEESSVERLTRRIEKWIDRDRLVSYGVRVLVAGQKPRRVYRIGDVLRLVEGDAPKKAPEPEPPVLTPEAC